MSVRIYLITMICFVSCVDPVAYKVESQLRRMEAQRESDSIMNEIKKMEDTIYKTRVNEDGDTILFRKVIK